MTIPTLLLWLLLGLVVLAWGPLSGGRGGGVASLLALDRAPRPLAAATEAQWLHQLSLATQLDRLSLMLLTHLGGLTVGVESPSAALLISPLQALAAIHSCTLAQLAAVGATALFASSNGCRPGSTLARRDLE